MENLKYSIRGRSKPSSTRRSKIHDSEFTASRSGLPALTLFGGQFLFQVIAENSSRVSLGIASRINWCYGSMPRRPRDYIAYFWMLLEFTPVALLKLKPFSRIVAEPLAKFRGRGDVFQPDIPVKLTFLYPARPQFLHQKSAAILTSRQFVSPL